jgi:superoxide dismutase, Fe-Mn family
MTFSMKPLSCDPARIKGMSERLIISHYENNYGGAVKRLNLIEEKLVNSITPGPLDFSLTA